MCWECTIQCATATCARQRTLGRVLKVHSTECNLCTGCTLWSALECVVVGAGVRAQAVFCAPYCGVCSVLTLLCGGGGGVGGSGPGGVEESRSIQAQRRPHHRLRLFLESFLENRRGGLPCTLTMVATLGRTAHPRFKEPTTMRIMDRSLQLEPTRGSPSNSERALWRSHFLRLSKLVVKPASTRAAAGARPPPDRPL